MYDVNYYRCFALRLNLYPDLNLRSRAREIMASLGTHASGAHFPYTFEIFGTCSHTVVIFARCSSFLMRSRSLNANATR